MQKHSASYSWKSNILATETFDPTKKQGKINRKIVEQLEQNHNI